MTSDKHPNLIEQKETSQSTIRKLLVFVLLVLSVGLLYWQFGDLLNLDYLAREESRLRTFQANHPMVVYGLAFLVYILVTGLSLPGAAVLTLVYGWYFGFLSGFILVSFASTTGATLAFLLSRFLFRESVETRFNSNLKTFNESLGKEGPFFLFTLRLIPAVPFFVINAVMGLTPIRVVTFWWVSQVGMLPGTAVYVYAGASVPNLRTLADKGVSAVFTTNQLTQFGIAFALLGLLPVCIRYGIKWMNRHTPTQE